MSHGATIVHTDLAADEDLSTGTLVRWGPSNATRYGEIDEIETGGEITSDTDGEGETTIEGTEENPAYLIQHFQQTGDGWEETDTFTVHRSDNLEVIDELPGGTDNVAPDVILSTGPTSPSKTPERLTSDDTSPGASTIITTNTGDGQPASQSQAAPPDPDSDLSVTDLRSAAQERDGIDLAVARGRVEQLQASAEDVQQINERHGLDLSSGEVELFRDFAASTGPMRGKRLRFTTAALERFVNVFQTGRPYVLHHNPDRFVGSTLRAQIVEDTEVRGFSGDWLAVDWFAVLRDATDRRRQDLMDVRTGLQYTSIRFTGGDWEMISEEVGEDETRFMLVDDNPDGDSFERLDAKHVSRVELGAVKGAGATPNP